MEIQAMRKYYCLYLTLFFAGCFGKDGQEYPDVITKLGIGDLYDISKFEIYKNSSNGTCSCSGFVFNSANRNDTLNVLTCDLTLDTMYQSGDTTTMYFSFLNYKKEKVHYINDIYKDCFHCIGIQFVDKRLYKAYFAEDGYLLYDDSKFFHPKDSLFMVTYKGEVNAWLKNYLKDSKKWKLL